MHLTSLLCIEGHWTLPSLSSRFLPWCTPCMGGQILALPLPPLHGRSDTCTYPPSPAWEVRYLHLPSLPCMVSQILTSPLPPLHGRSLVLFPFPARFLSTSCMVCPFPALPLPSLLEMSLDLLPFDPGSSHGTHLAWEVSFSHILSLPYMGSHWTPFPFRFLPWCTFCMLVLFPASPLPPLVAH